VLVVFCVPLALLTADAASHRAGFHRGGDEVEIGLGQACDDAAGCLTDIGTVEAQANATDELVPILFLSEAGVGATDAGRCTLDTRVDATQEHLEIDFALLRVYLHDLADRHLVSSRSQGAAAGILPSRRTRRGTCRY